MKARYLLTVTARLCTIAVACSTAQAGEWTIDPRFNLSESYSDNITLVDQGKSGDLITTVLPGMTVRAASPRLDMNVDYNLQYLNYLDNSQFNDLNHQLQSDAELTVVKNLLFFDIGARMSQQNTSSASTFAESNRSQTGNRSNVLFYEYGPALRQSIARWASLEASLRKNTSSRSTVQTVQNAPKSGSDEEVISVDLRSGPRVSRTPIGIAFTSRDQESGSGRSSTLKRLTSDVGFRLNRQFTLDAEGGAEFNEIASGNSKQDGPFWYVGGTWTPSARTELSGRFGNRFFGNTFKIQAKHRIRRAVFSFGYEEEIKTQNQIQSELQFVPLFDAFGNPILSPDVSSDFEQPLGNASLQDQVLLNTDIRASATYAGRRNNFDMQFFDSKHESQDTGSVSKTRGLTFNFSHQLSRLTTASLNGLWRESKSGSGGNNNRVFRLTPSFQIRFGPNINLNLNYEFVDGSGDDPGNEFTENAVTADIAYVF